MSGTDRFPWLRYLLAFMAIAVFALWPIASVVTAASIAGADHCALDEGSVHPCMVAGSDWGETLYAMGVLGWLMLATLPLGGIAGLILVIALIFHRGAWRRARRPAQ